MNYKALHDNIISRAIQRGKTTDYCERHHIVMRSMGGSDAADNLVWLTGREHYLVHWLLFKIHRNKQTVFAWHRMTFGRRDVGRYTSHTFAYAKRAKAAATSILFSGRKFTPEHKEKLRVAKAGRTYEEIGRISSPLKGRPISEAHKAKLAASSAGREWSEESRRRLSEARMGERNPAFGKTYSAEERAEISARTKAGIARIKALKEAA